MKDLMIVLNGMITVGSVLSTVWFLISGCYGAAWICAGCGAFGYGNLYAIFEN